MGEKKTQEDLFGELADIKEKVNKLGEQVKGKPYKKCPVCKGYIDISEGTDCPCGKASFDEKENKWILKNEKSNEKNEEKVFGGIFE